MVRPGPPEAAARLSVRGERDSPRRNQDGNAWRSLVVHAARAREVCRSGRGSDYYIRRGDFVFGDFVFLIHLVTL